MNSNLLYRSSFVNNFGNLRNSYITEVFQSRRDQRDEIQDSFNRASSTFFFFVGIVVIALARSTLARAAIPVSLVRFDVAIFLALTTFFATFLATVILRALFFTRAILFATTVVVVVVVLAKKITRVAYLEEAIATEYSIERTSTCCARDV